MKILLVEDDPYLGELTKFRLEINGYEVHWVTDGLDAIEYIGEQIPDLILLDISLPRLDGFAVCNRIKNDERTKGIPVVIITASGMRDIKTRALRSGATAYIRKPFDGNSLVDKIKEILREKQ